MKTTKITAKIYQPLWTGFQKQVSALSLNRDAFLSDMISGETPHLQNDLAERVLSSKAKRYISNELNRIGHDQKQGLVPVSISIHKEIANALNEVVANSNIVRDAFINRLLVFLRSSDVILNHFKIPRHIDGIHGAMPFPTSPLKAMEEVRKDPFYYIRASVKSNHDEGLYTLRFPSNLVGFSCYLTDDQVPGTRDHKKAQKVVAALLEPDVTEDAFVVSRTTGKGRKS